MPMKNNREYRDMTLNIVERDDAAEETEQSEEMRVSGYASTFNEPYVLYSDDELVYREQVDSNAFADTDMSDVIMQYDHEGRVFARLSNGTMELTEDEHGLKVNANLGGTEIGRNLYQEIKGGYTNKMSFGFTVAESDIVPDGDNQYIRTIRKIGKLFDYWSR